MATRTVTLTNLLSDPSQWSLSNVNIVQFSGYGNTFQLLTGGLAMATCSVPAPTVGHKYYGRCVYMTDAGGFSCEDGRFEYYHSDTPNDLMVFQSAVGNDTGGQVRTESSIQSISASVSSDTTWTFRNFIVNGTQAVYRAFPLLIDLTAAFGAGNEPDQAWCDSNIPSFYGETTVIFNSSRGAYIGVGGVARKVKKGYVGVNSEIPIYNTVTKTVTNTWSPEDYFTITDVSYGFDNAGYGVFESTNNGKSSSKSETTWKARIDLTVSFDYTWSTETNYDKFYIIANGTTIVDGVSGEGSSSASVALKAGEILILRYTKDASTDSGDDKCSISRVCISYNVVEQTGTEVKEVARKIKKAYAGIGGVARLVWSTGVTYNGTATALAQARNSFAATTIGNYALFGGGSDGTVKATYYNTVDAYDTSLARTSPSKLREKSDDLAATTVGNYALFAGGYGGYNGTSYLATVTAYDTSLSRSAPTDLSHARRYLIGASTNTYALFAGGDSSATGASATTVDYYNTALTRGTATGLIEGVDGHAATTVGNYVLFAGGERYNTEKAIVTAYDTSLTRSQPTNLSVARSHLAGARVDNYGIFAGGMDSDGNAVDTVDAYNTSLTRSIISALSSRRQQLSATTVGNYAILGGGIEFYTSTTIYSDILDVYDNSLSRCDKALLSSARRFVAATAIGNYALFGGGSRGNTNYDIVDVYAGN